MSKRRRCDESNVTVEDAAAAIGTIASRWRDSVGVALYVQQKLKNDRQKLLYQLLEFDSLRCDDIHDIVQVQLPGDFVISTLFCVSATKSLDITIVRRQIEAAPSVMVVPADLTAEITRLRIATIVATEDVLHVKDAIASLLRALPTSATWVVTPQPSAYRICFTKVATLAGSAVTIASRLSASSVYDFENATLTVDIKRTTPEIMF